MIVENAANLRAGYERLENVKVVQTRVQHIRDTRASLEELEGPVREATTALGLIRDRLPIEERIRLTRRLELLAGIIQRSEKDFATHPRQVQNLISAENTVKAILGEIDQAWQGYARAQTAGYWDLLGIVRRLPDLAPQSAALHQALVAMDPPSQAAPRGDARLRAFDDGLGRIRDRARAFSALPTPVLTFLTLVAQEQASLAHLTPEVLAWLDEHDYLSSFDVRFAGLV